MNLINLDEGATIFVEVKKFFVFTSKNFPDGIDAFEVVNLETGEEQTMWVDGGLRGATSTLGGPEGLIGMKVEIKRGKQKTLQVANEQGKLVDAKVNSYDIFELN